MTRILVVDDQEENRYMLQVLLRSRGHDVVLAEDGARALTAAHQDPPGLVISDILMPGMDGFALCRAWMKDDLLREIPFIFYTATYTGLKDEEFALSLGAARFIVKPMEVEPFMAIIEDVLRDWVGGQLAKPGAPPVDEEVYLKTYNAALVRKLEDKVQQLEATQIALEADIAARIQAEEALRLHSAAIASAADAIVITDRSGEIQWVNPAFTGLTGYSASEVIGRNPRLLKSGVHEYDFYRCLWETILAGETWRGEMVNRHKDGSLYTEQTSITPVRDAAGAITHFVSIHQDITERKRTEQAEREQRALAEALRDTAAALASTLSPDEVLDRILIEVGRVVPHDAAHIILIEDGLTKIVRSRGYVEPGWAPPTQEAEVPVDDVANLRAILQSGHALAIPDTSVFPGWEDWPQMYGVRSNASAPIRVKEQVIGFLGLNSATPGFFTQGHAERLQAFADEAAVAIENSRLYDAIRRHASELEEKVASRTAELTLREAALRSANEQLQQLSRLKTELVSNVSHELRTPLANIKTHLWLLEHGKPARAADYMATLHRESALLQRLIEDLLFLSGLDLGKLQPSYAPVDLNRLVTLLVGDRTMMFADRGLSLEAYVESDLPQIQADEKMLTQVLTNLMTNAMNFTPKGGKVTVRTCLEHGNGGVSAVHGTLPTWVTFSVTDTGPGISAADQMRLFERFFRGEAAHQSGTPGTGLGLAICKELVERHRGRLTLESQVGKGSTFAVWLPAQAPAEGA